MGSSIQARVLALVGAAVFIAGALLSLLSRSSLLALETELHERNARVAAVLSAAIGAAVREDLSLLARTADGPHVDLDDRRDEPERSALDEALRHARLFSAAAFVDGSGALAVASEGIDGAALSSAAFKDVLARAVGAGRPLAGSVMAAASGRRFVVLLVPLQPHQGRAAGAALGIVDVPSRYLDALAAALALGPQVRVALVDGEGQALLAGREVPESASMSSVPVAGSSWELQLYDTSPDPLGPIAAFRNRSLWLAPSLTALAMLFGWGIAKSVRRPLTLLTRSAERIAHGDLEVPVDTSGSQAAGDEIARLAGALEGMRASLKSSMDTIARANRELEQRVLDRTRELVDVNIRLEERERLRRHLLRQLISAQEDERRRIARDLHDELSQTLAGLGMGVNAVVGACADPATRERLFEIGELVHRMHEELARLIVNLRPSVLDDLGLAAAIAWFAEHHLGTAGLSFRCELDDLTARLSPEAEIAIFRAVQEAIVNVSRHARAETVLIQAAAPDGRLVIEIEDDGEGFDPADAAGEPGSLRGIGLLGMRERIEILGGTVVVDSEPGRGTRVVIDVPATC
jgi:signal transduction histidine kinase